MEVVTKVEVEVKTGVDVVDVKVDESEVNVVMEDEKEVDVLVLVSVVVLVDEPAIVSVTTCKSRRGRETNQRRWSWPSCTCCDLVASAPVPAVVCQ